MDVKSKQNFTQSRLSYQPVRRGHDPDIFHKGDAKTHHPPTSLTDPEKYLCWVCRRILRNPHVAECGHRFCQGCLYEVLGTKGYLPCEGCRLDGTPGVYITRGYSDMAMRRELGRLHCVCPTRGCSWTGKLDEYEGKHEDQCQFGHSVCDLCGQNIATDKLSEHRQSCPAALTECPHCQASLEQSKVQNHISDNCPEVKIRTISSKLTNLEKKLKDSSATLDDFSSRILALETSSADGTFVWKITGFAKCRRDAVSGSQPYLLSPSFTTGRPGYQ